MQNEVEEVEPKQNEIAVIANNITTGLAAFETRKAELVKLKSDAEGLKIESLDDKESINKVSIWRKKLKSSRVEIEKEGKSMRNPLTKINKEISEKENELIAIIEPTEKALKAQEDWVKAEQDKIDQENERKEQERIQVRIDRLAEYGYAIDITFLKGIDDEQFEKVLDSARTEWEKEQAILEQEKRIAKENQEKIEKDLAELQALRDRQAETDQILKERQDELDRQEKALKDEQERVAEEGRKKAKADEESKIKSRIAQLSAFGLVFKFDTNQYEGFACAVHYFDITGYDNEKWDKMIEGIGPHIQEYKKQEAEKAEEKRLKDLEAARQQAIAEEQDRQRKAKEKTDETERLAEIQRQQELEKASDKDKWTEFITQLSALSLPTLRSGQYRKIAGMAREKIEEIQKLKA